MSHEVIIETRNLTKVYRDFWGRPKVQALKALDLQVYRGEIFGLLGPNGSGKTTTIKLLLGLLFATEGEALIFNEPTTNVAKNERIGYLPEESYLYKFLNAEETLQFYGRLFKISRAERNKRVGRLIDMVGLDRRQASPAPRVLQGHAAAHRAGPGPDQQPRADPAGRADLGPRPDRHVRDQAFDPRAARAGQDDRPVGPPSGRHAGHLRPDRDPASRRAQGDRPGLRPPDGPGRHADQGAQSQPGRDRGDPRRDSSARRRGRDGRPSHDDARRAVPADRPRKRAAPRPPQGGTRHGAAAAPQPGELAGTRSKPDALSVASIAACVLRSRTGGSEPASSAHRRFGTDDRRWISPALEEHRPPMSALFLPWPLLWAQANAAPIPQAGAVNPPPIDSAEWLVTLKWLYLWGDPTVTTKTCLGGILTWLKAIGLDLPGRAGSSPGW